MSGCKKDTRGRRMSGLLGLPRSWDGKKSRKGRAYPPNGMRLTPPNGGSGKEGGITWGFKRWCLVVGGRKIGGRL